MGDRRKGIATGSGKREGELVRLAERHEYAALRALGSQGSLGAGWQQSTRAFI
jgi:hypothetical protein